MRARPSMVMVVVLGLLLGTIPSALAGAIDDDRRSADLEGKPIALRSVAQHHCHDVDAPVIRCFRTAGERDASVVASTARVEGALAAAVIYVTMYDGSAYGGASMAVSQDYDVLATIGWNDRVSSYKARHAETGTFFTDWFAGGAADAFCCNHWVPSLGSSNDLFSSLYRT